MIGLIKITKPDGKDGWVNPKLIVGVFDDEDDTILLMPVTGYGIKAMKGDWTAESLAAIVARNT